MGPKLYAPPCPQFTDSRKNAEVFPPDLTFNRKILRKEFRDWCKRKNLDNLILPKRHGKNAEKTEAEPKFELCRSLMVSLVMLLLVPPYLNPVADSLCFTLNLLGDETLHFMLKLLS